MAQETQQLAHLIRSHGRQLNKTLTALENNSKLLNTIRDTPEIRNECANLILEARRLSRESANIHREILLGFTSISQRSKRRLSRSFGNQCKLFEDRVKAILQTLRQNLNLTNPVTQLAQLFPRILISEAVQRNELFISQLQTFQAGVEHLYAGSENILSSLTSSLNVQTSAEDAIISPIQLIPTLAPIISDRVPIAPNPASQGGFRPALRKIRDYFSNLLCASSNSTR